MDSWAFAAPHNFLSTTFSPFAMASEHDKARASELKDEGNQAFQREDYQTSVNKFTEAIELDPSNHVFLSNRSASYLKLGKTEEAIKDARACIELAPTWGKGFSRLGAALQETGKIQEAVTAFLAGLAVDPTNASLSSGLMEAQKAAAAEAAAAAGGAGGADADDVDNAKAERNKDDKYPEDFKGIIGIDLGTTYSCVAVWLEDQQRTEVFANSEGSRTTASVVAFTDSDRLIGQPAQDQAAANSSNTVYDAKRLIGRSIKDPAVVEDMKKFPFKVFAPDGDTPMVEVVFKGEARRFAPEEISAMVLVKMKQTAEAALRQNCRRAVITVPAYFSDAQRKATKNAGAIAGLEVMRIVNEPTAAALAYGLDKQAADKAAELAQAAQDEADAEAEGLGLKVGGKKQKEAKKGPKGPGYVLIFDLGGGTFDVSLLTIQEGIFEVKATGGDTHLGGEDFDSAIQDFVVTEFKRKHKAELDTKAGKGEGLTSDKRAQRRLRTACERAKRMLSTATQANIEVDSWYEGIDLSIVLTRAKFEQLNEKFFVRCIDTVKNVLKDAKAKPEEVSDVVLVGGSTRIPKVQAMLSEHFAGKELCKAINPDEAVAVGAAVQGAILSGAQSATTQSLVLVDVTPLSLGIETDGKLMSVIIKRNTPIPARRTSTYTTTEDYQDSVDVDVYEGERPTTKDNNHLGHFVISGIERAKRQVPKIEVTFDLDANGILNVTAMDQTTRAKANITINAGVGHLSTDEIERMVANAEKMKAEDEATMARIEAKNALERTIYYARETAAQRDSTSIREAMEFAQAWLDESPEMEVKDYRRETLKLEKAMNRTDEDEKKPRGRGGRR